MSVNMLDVVQKSARKGTLLASCEPEVKELMHQIDVLLSSKQDESKTQVQGLKNQLQQREREMSSLRVAMQEKTTQVEKMKSDVKRLEQQLRIQSSDHDTQLLRMKSELNRLSKSYERLKSRRTLNEDNTTEMVSLKQELERVHGHCESQQSQITQLSQELDLSRTHQNTLQEQNRMLQEELKVCQEHSKSRLFENEKKLKESLSQSDSQLKLCQDSLKSRDRKIQSLRAERDELKKKLRSVMDDFQKLQEASVALANDNKSYQVGVADLELQLTREQSDLQTCSAHNTQLQQQLAVSHELLKNKEKLIQSLDSRYKNKIESEVSVLNTQMKDLLEKVEIMKRKETMLREENSKLKEKFKGRHNSSNSINSIISSDSLSTPITSYRAKIVEKDQLVTSLEERVHHLEDQLTEATSAQFSVSTSSSSNSSIGCIVSTNDMSPIKQSQTLSRQALSNTEGTTSRLSFNEATTSTDSLHKVSENFQSGMRQLSSTTCSTSSTDTAANQQNPLLETFRHSLDIVLTEHFNKIDQSLRNTSNALNALNGLIRSYKFI